MSAPASSRVRRLVGWLAAIVLVGWTAAAHDIPNERVDRSIQVEVGPGRLEIVYEVSLSELTLVQDLRNLVGQVPGADRGELFDRYGRETGPLNARGFLVTVDGRDVDMVARGFDLAIEEHPRFTFHLEGPIPPRGHLVVQDTNYVSSEGTSRLAVRGALGVFLSGYDGVADVSDVPIVPVWQLTDDEERRTKRLELDYEPASTASIASPIGRVPAEPAASGRAPGSEVSGGLTRLLDRATTASPWLLWSVALVLGMAHAIQPGHGKTLVAAATVGGRGGGLRGAVLALATTLAHFSSVLLIAWALWLTRTSRVAEVHLALTCVAGFVIAAVGLWRLGRHLAGFGEHQEVSESDGLGLRGLFGLGVAGGMVPCWDAVVLVLLADLAGRLALAVWLLAGFSLGMAVVLVAVGMAAGRARSWLDGREGGPDWGRGLGIVSGLALSGIGLYLLMS